MPPAFLLQWNGYPRVTDLHPLQTNPVGAHDDSVEMCANYVTGCLA